MIKHILQYIIILFSGLFDRQYYLNEYPDVSDYQYGPILHFITIGWKEGKKPSLSFDTLHYLSENLDVRQAKINPLIHYIRFGKREGRSPAPASAQPQQTYHWWIRDYDTLTNEDRTLIKSHMAEIKHDPLISVLMVIMEPQERFLRESLDSVVDQIYPHWELCICYSGSYDPNIHKLLVNYQQQDTRIKVKLHTVNSDTVPDYQALLSISSGEYFGILGEEDLLSEHALYLFAYEVNCHPDADLVFSDEDRIDQSGIRYDPYLKPEWNPDLFLAQNDVSGLFLFKSDKVIELDGLPDGLDGTQPWDLAIRFSEVTSTEKIRHIPFVLYHQRTNIIINTKSQTNLINQIAAQRQVIDCHLKRTKQSAEIKHHEAKYWQIKYKIPNPTPLVSIIIPTKNQQKLLERCLNSIWQKTIYPNFEIILIDNQSEEPTTLAYFERIKHKGNVHFLDFKNDFNYSAINNFGVKHAKGNILALLNNDTEIISPNWLAEMIGHAIRPEIGAVGAKLYFPDNTIQHAGVILGLLGAIGHIYYQFPGTHQGQRGRARLAQNYTTITAACMVIEKQKFLKLGGFNEYLPVAFNDIDLCLRLVEAGYRNLWTPFAELYHHESASRGYEDTFEKRSRFEAEKAYMVSQWGEMIESDPAYNPNLTLETADCSLAFPPRTIKPWLDNHE